MESHRSGEGPGCTVLVRAQQWVRDEHTESHRSGEGPGCIAVGQGRAHGESPFW